MDRPNNTTSFLAEMIGRTPIADAPPVRIELRSSGFQFLARFYTCSGVRSSLSEGKEALTGAKRFLAVVGSRINYDEKEKTRHPK